MRHRRRGRANKGHRRHQMLKFEDIEKRFKKQDEDVLKYIYEQKESKITFSELNIFLRKVNGRPDKILKRLLIEGLLVSEDGTYILTSRGIEIAKLILKKHEEIENYIKSKTNSCNAHEMAHILEHELSEEAIRGIIKASALKGRGKCLNEFRLPHGVIVDVNLEQCNVWTKLISLGIFPGQRIQILSRTATNYIIMVKSSKLAIDRILAEGIYLVP